MVTMQLKLHPIMIVISVCMITLVWLLLLLILTIIMMY